MSLVDLAQEDLYGKGISYAGDDFIPNRNTEFWFTPLGYGQRFPGKKSVQIDVAAVTGARVITVSSSSGFTLNRGDVLLFDDADSLVTIAETTFIGKNTDLSVYPLQDDIAVDDFAVTYALHRVLSAKEGQSFENRGNSATAFNKMQGVWTSSTIVQKGGTLLMSGSYYRNDIGADLLFNEGTEKRNKIYIEIRYSPFLDFTDKDGNVYRRGEGVGAISCMGALEVVNLTNRRGREGLVKFDMRLKLDGIPVRYQVVTGLLTTNYCVQNISGFYNINFTVTPEQGDSDYCVQDTTGFYDFAQEP